MKQRSRRAKGRYLQNIVRDRIVQLYPVLTKKDIRTSSTGENSADIKLLSNTAKKLFSYEVETKNRSDFVGLYSHFKQAIRHGPKTPILIVKGKREKPLAVIDMEHFFELLEN